MTDAEHDALIPWLQDCTKILADAGYATAVHNDLGGVGLIVQTPQGRKEWCFFVLPFSAADVEGDLRIHAGKLGVKLPARESL